MVRKPRQRACATLTLLALWLLPLAGRSEEPKEDPVQLLSIDPVWFFYQAASFRYERLFTNSGSLALDLEFGRMAVKPSVGDPYERTMVGLGVAYHFYPFAATPMGFFAAPGLDFFRRYRTVGSATVSLFIVAPFVEVGYNWAHPSGFYAGASAGVQYVLGSASDDVGGLGSLGSGLVPRAGVHLGYAW
jgi:hypothetical protein